MAATHELSQPKAAPSRAKLEGDGLHLGGSQRRSIACSCGWAVYAHSDDEALSAAEFHLRNKNKPSRAAADRLRKARARNSTPR